MLTSAAEGVCDVLVLAGAAPRVRVVGAAPLPDELAPARAAPPPTPTHAHRNNKPQPLLLR
eukprot:5475557-Pleurochrysis_carterae.AAC.1